MVLTDERNMSTACSVLGKDCEENKAWVNWGVANTSGTSRSKEFAICFLKAY